MAEYTDRFKFDPHATGEAELMRRRSVAYHISGHAHWEGIKVRQPPPPEVAVAVCRRSQPCVSVSSPQSLFLCFTITGVGIIYANRNFAGFRHALRAPQKAGLSLMPPIGMYGYVSAGEM